MITLVAPAQKVICPDTHLRRIRKPIHTFYHIHFGLFVRRYQSQNVSADFFYILIDCPKNPVMSSEAVKDHHSYSAPEQFFDIFFDVFHSLHNSLLGFFVLGRYVVHEHHHEIGDTNLPLLHQLFKFQCNLMNDLINRLATFKGVIQRTLLNRLIISVTSIASFRIGAGITGAAD